MSHAISRDYDLYADDISLGYRDGLISTSDAAEQCGVSPATYLRVARTLNIEPTDTTKVERNDRYVTAYLWSGEQLRTIRDSDAVRRARARHAARMEREADRYEALLAMEGV